VEAELGLLLVMNMAQFASASILLMIRIVPKSGSMRIAPDLLSPLMSHQEMGACCL